jgi:hypothetical protein
VTPCPFGFGASSRALIPSGRARALAGSASAGIPPATRRSIRERASPSASSRFSSTPTGNRRRAPRAAPRPSSPTPSPARGSTPTRTPAGTICTIFRSSKGSAGTGSKAEDRSPCRSVGRDRGARFERRRQSRPPGRRPDLGRAGDSCPPRSAAVRTVNSPPVCCQTQGSRGRGFGAHLPPNCSTPAFLRPLAPPWLWPPCA